MKAADRRALIRDLDLVLTRIRSGLTLTQALRDLSPPRADAEFRREWEGVREGVLAGRVSAEDAVFALRLRLRTEERLESDLQRCTAQPRAQGWLVSALAVAFGLYQSLLAPELLRPRPLTWLAVLPLLATGLWTLRLLIARVRRHLWLADWILALRRLESGLRWGESLPALLARTPPPPTLPKVLAAAWCSLQTRLRLGHPPTPSKGPPISKSDHGSVAALETLSWLERLFHEGHSVREVLSGSLTSFEEQLADRLALESEALKLRLLVPLFVFFLPAFAAFLLDPLLRALTT